MFPTGSYGGSSSLLAVLHAELMAMVGGEEGLGNNLQAKFRYRYKSMKHLSEEVGYVWDIRVYRI